MSELDQLIVVNRESANTVTIATETGIVIGGSTTDSVNTTEVQHVVVSTGESITITSSGSQGPPGIPGDSINYVNMVAGTTLSGHRAVCSDNNGKVIYADNTITVSADTVLGITTGAASNGTVCEVQIVGLLEEPSWTWIPQLPIYVSSDGMLTQTVPEIGYVYQIAFAVSTTKVFINKQPPIIVG